MANKFEMGSSAFAIPQDANKHKHLNDKELEQAMQMYGANDYEEDIDPVEYRSKQETSKKAAKKIIAFQEHIKQKELNEELKKAKQKKVGFRITRIGEIFSRVA